MRRRFVKKEIATKYIKGKHRKRVKLFRRKGDDRLIYKIRKQIDSFRINNYFLPRKFAPIFQSRLIELSEVEQRSNEAR